MLRGGGTGCWGWRVDRTDQMMMAPNAASFNNSDRIAVIAACNRLLRAVWRYPKMLAHTTVASGTTKVTITTKADERSGFSEADRPKMTAIATPAPTIAAIKETSRTSFKRISE